MNIRFLLLFTLIGFGIGSFAQQTIDDYPPLLKGYEGNEGKVTKKHFFNYMMLKDETGEKERQATGRYWEVNYVYDSVFRQKQLFASFMVDQIKGFQGILFFSDTTQIHFAIPRDSLPNVWGKVLLKSDRVYRIQVIEEVGFTNQVEFDSDYTPAFDEFVTPVEFPPRLGYLPNSIVTSARYSKFNHFTISFVENQASYRQNLMGPYWDLKMKVTDSLGETDSRVSTVEIMESYFRAALKADGKVIKSHARELIFNIPVGDDKKLWVRVMTSLDGLYLIRMVLQNNSDETAPVGIIRTPSDEEK